MKRETGSTIFALTLFGIALWLICLGTFHSMYDNIDYDFYETEEYIYILCGSIAFIVIYVLGIFLVRWLYKKLAPCIKEELNKIVEEYRKYKEANKPWYGTGIIGLKNYVTFFKLMAVFLIVAALPILSEEDLRIYGYYMLVVGIACILNIPFIKALITIVKAAKVYLEKNSK